VSLCPGLCAENEDA